MQSRPRQIFLELGTISLNKLSRIVQFLKSIIRTVLGVTSARYVQCPDNTDLHTVNCRHFSAFGVSLAQDLLVSCPLHILFFQRDLGWSLFLPPVCATIQVNLLVWSTKLLIWGKTVEMPHSLVDKCQTSIQRCLSHFILLLVAAIFHRPVGKLPMQLLSYHLEPKGLGARWGRKLLCVWFPKAFALS